MRPAGTISDAKLTKSDCGSGAVVRHQPRAQATIEVATLLIFLIPDFAPGRREPRYIDALAEPQGFKVLIRWPSLQNSSCFWA